MENTQEALKEPKRLEDLDLNSLAYVANKGLTVGVTFFASGFMFVGTMISGKEYYETTIQKLRAAGESGEALAAVFESIAPLYEAELVDKVPNDFIFIKGLKSHNGQNNDFGESLFKFKTSEITGFSIGVPQHLKNI